MGMDIDKIKEVVMKDYCEKLEWEINYGKYQEKTFYIVDGWTTIRKFETLVREDISLGNFSPDLLADMEEWSVELGSIEDMNNYTSNALEYLTEGEWGFSDEYSTCDGCYKVVRTSPDCYSWTPKYDCSDNGLYCTECIDAEEYIEVRIDNYKNANQLIEESRLEEIGFKKLEGYQNGWYGIYDDPHTILKKMQGKMPGYEFVFSISGVGQFHTNFDIWGRPKYECDYCGDRISEFVRCSECNDKLCSGCVVSVDGTIFCDACD